MEKKWCRLCSTSFSWPGRISKSIAGTATLPFRRTVASLSNWAQGGYCNNLMHRKKNLRLVTGMQRLVKNDTLLTDISPWSQECWICEVEGWISGLWISWNSFHTWMFLWHVWDIWETYLTMHTFGWMISLSTVLCGFSDNCSVLAALFFPQGCSQSEPTHCLGACAFACLPVHVVSCTSYVASTCTRVYIRRI